MCVLKPIYSLIYDKLHGLYGILRCHRQFGCIPKSKQCFLLSLRIKQCTFLPLMKDPGSTDWAASQNIYMSEIQEAHTDKEKAKNKIKAASLMTSWHVQIWGSNSMWITTMWILLCFRIEAELRSCKQNYMALIYTCVWRPALVHGVTCPCAELHVDRII